MDNKKLYQLLIKSPQQFIAHPAIGEVIEKTVFKFVSKGGIPGYTTEDIISEVRLVILEKKLKYISEKYNPQFSTVKGYMSKVTFNICVELLRKQQKKPVLKNTLDDLNESTLERETGGTTPETSFIAQEIINSELERLRNYLRVFAKYKTKLILLLKLYCRIPLKEEDLQNYVGGLPISEWEFYYQTFSVEYSKYSDKEVYQLIMPLINKIENKTNASGSLRKWVDTKVLALREVMNQHPHYQYDTETFKNLIRLL